jgi:hypothetical protein
MALWRCYVFAPPEVLYVNRVSDSWRRGQPACHEEQENEDVKMDMSVSCK